MFYDLRRNLDTWNDQADEYEGTYDYCSDCGRKGAGQYFGPWRDFYCFRCDAKRNAPDEPADYDPNPEGLLPF